jgi:hypothetical protein
MADIDLAPARRQAQAACSVGLSAPYCILRRAPCGAEFRDKFTDPISLPATLSIGAPASMESGQ